MEASRLFYYLALLLLVTGTSTENSDSDSDGETEEDIYNKEDDDYVLDSDFVLHQVNIE